jgi:methylase of polypeptide subunit release factors
MDKLELASMARDYMKQAPYGTFNFRGKDIVVLPTVFMPDSNTPLLSELVEKLAEECLKTADKCKVYEMGAGSGAAIVYLAQHSRIEAYASDIAPMAALNIKANALWWDAPCQVFEGSLFDNTPEGKFDIIFWNIPFFREDPGGVEDVKFRAGFDPEYQYLKKFLKEAYENRLSDKGKVLLAVDEDMCDRPIIHQLIEEAGFRWNVHEQRTINWGEMPVRFAFLLLEK